MVGIAKKKSVGETDTDAFSVEESLTELSELVGTAGLEVAGSTFQKVREGREGGREGGRGGHRCGRISDRMAGVDGKGEVGRQMKAERLGLDRLD